MSLYASFLSVVSFGAKNCIRKPIIASFRQFHSSGAIRGFEEFKDVVKQDEVMKTGRAWTNADLRRKVCSCRHSPCNLLSLFPEF